jgi:hypothetical protein
MSRKKTTSTKMVDATKTVANFLFVPPPGSRKTHITLWIIFPFMLVAGIALFTMKIDPIQWLKTVGDMLATVAGLFMGGNAVEGIGNSIIQRKQGYYPPYAEQDPNYPTPPGPPVPSPFLKPQNQGNQGGPPIAPTPKSSSLPPPAPK